MSLRAVPHTPGRILVTGASGNVGREVVRELASLSMRLHSTLVRAGLRPGLTR